MFIRYHLKAYCGAQSATLTVHFVPLSTTGSHTDPPLQKVEWYTRVLGGNGTHIRYNSEMQLLLVQQLILWSKHILITETYEVNRTILIFTNDLENRTRTWKTRGDILPRAQGSIRTRRLLNVLPPSHPAIERISSHIGNQSSTTERHVEVWEGLRATLLVTVSRSFKCDEGYIMNNIGK